MKIKELKEILETYELKDEDEIRISTDNPEKEEYRAVTNWIINIDNTNGTELRLE